MSGVFLTEDEQLLRLAVRELADRELAPRASHYDQNEEFPRDNLRRMAEMGLFGLTIDEEYGGSGGTARQLAVVIEELARGCGATSVVYIAHLALCAQYINRFGSETQKRELLPPLVDLSGVGAFALTEPGAGSDAASIRTSLSRVDGHFLLNGSKLFTTNAVEADTFVVLATHDPGQGTKGIDAVVVERGTPGFTINPQHGKMGMRGSSTAELLFEGCRIPEEDRLGGEGVGWAQTMDVLNASRVGIAAQCVGLAQAAYESALQYAGQREAFGRQLSGFQSVQWTLADMATEIDAARLLVYRAASLLDDGAPFVTEASMAKLFASRVAVECADRAVQLHGGTGYFAPTTAERLYRDARVTEIYEGTSEVQRMIISRGILGG
jgi:alkylation response protein AidB-like acyl-CoA dehydrogenase